MFCLLWELKYHRNPNYIVHRNIVDFAALFQSKGREVHHDIHSSSQMAVNTHTHKGTFLVQTHPAATFCTKVIYYSRDWLQQHRTRSSRSKELSTQFISRVGFDVILPRGPRSLPLPDSHSLVVVEDDICRMLGTGGGGGVAPVVIRFSRSLLAADRWWGTGLKVLLLLLVELFLRKDVDVGSSTWCKDTTPVEVVTVEPRGRSPTLASPDDDEVVVVVVVVLGAGTGPPCESCDDDL